MCGLPKSKVAAGLTSERKVLNIIQCCQSWVANISSLPNIALIIVIMIPLHQLASLAIIRTSAANLLMKFQCLMQKMIILTLVVENLQKSIGF